MFSIDVSITRKTFLKILGWISLAGPVLLSSACGGGGGSGDPGGDGAAPQKVDAFKLSTRGRDSCKACKNHANFKLFKTRTAADINRAHAGCNCVIKVYPILVSDADIYFARSPIYDRRRISG
jgi:hypothetical protein